MAKLMAKCLYCNEQFDRNKEEYVKINRRYAHKKCHDLHHKEMEQKEKDRIQLEEYICKLYGSVLPLHRKQIATLLKANYTYLSIYKTLYYFYDIRGNTTEKSTGIGIVPYVALEAKKYYDDLERLKNKEQQVVSIETNKNVKKIKIKTPIPKRKGLKKIDFDFIGEE